MRSPKTLAGLLAGSPLIALLISPIATAQQENVPPPGRPVTLPPPASAVEVQETTPAPADTPEDQARQDRELAESFRGQTEIDPASVRVSIPSGWVRVAVDLDGDGTFDTIETIHADDLRQARMISANRQQGADGALPEGLPLDQEGDQDLDQDQDPSIRISGTVQDIQEFRLAGFATPHRLARVETEQGVAKVDFGPTESLQDLPIEQGDEVTVVGYRGMINDRPVLMATSVSKGEDSMDVESPDDAMIKRVRGEVVGTRTVSFRSRDEDHLIAELEFRSGNRAEVILGPKSKLDDLDLSEGDTLSLLVRPAMLNGQPAMAAEQVRIGDQAIAIRDPVDEPVQIESEKEDESDSNEDESDSEESPRRRDIDAPSLSDPAPGGEDS